MRGVVVCPTCGSLVFGTDARKCAKCGQPLTPSAPPEPSALRARVVDAEATDAPPHEEWTYITGRVVTAEKPPERRSQSPAAPYTLEHWAQRLHQPREWLQTRLHSARSPRAWSLAALTALLLVTVIVSVLRASMLTVPAAALQLHRDDDGLFSIGSPVGWHMASAGGDPISTTVFADSQGSASLTLQYAAPAEGSTVSAARTYLDSFRDGTGAISNMHGPDTVSIAGESWTQLSADEHEGSKPTLYHVVALAAIHSHYMVMIALVDTAGDFDYANARYFQPMLRQLVFLR